MNGKQIFLTSHANERLLERKIPPKILPKIIKNGVRIQDPISGATLCIYNYKSTYYTLVMVEKSEEFRVITIYESSEWQIKQFNKVKRNENNPKML